MSTGSYFGNWPKVLKSIEIPNQLDIYIYQRTQSLIEDIYGGLPCANGRDRSLQIVLTDCLEGYVRFLGCTATLRGCGVGLKEHTIYICVYIYI